MSYTSNMLKFSYSSIQSYLTKFENVIRVSQISCIANHSNLLNHTFARKFTKSVHTMIGKVFIQKTLNQSLDWHDQRGKHNHNQHLHTWWLWSNTLAGKECPTLHVLFVKTKLQDIARRYTNICQCKNEWSA